MPGVFVILYYHGIPEAERRRFAWQMDALRRLAKPVPADFRGPLRDGARYAAVTFDDGFQSVVDNGLAELKSRDIPATLFVPTAVLGRRASWERDPGARADWEVVLDEEELARLPADLVTIGSHSRTHPHMTELDAETAEEELVGSRRDLELLLGRPIRLFSPPYGEYTEELLEQCRKANYERVYSISPKLALQSPEEYVTGRVAVDADDWRLEFWLKLLGAYRWLPRASAILRRIRSWR